MTNLRLIFIALTLILSGSAFGALDRVEEILELELSDVRLPAHEVDRVVISQCEECGSLALNVSAATEYRIGGFEAEKVSLQELRAAIRKTRRKSELLVYVGYAPGTNVVTRIVVSSGAK